MALAGSDILTAIYDEVQEPSGGTFWSAAGSDAAITRAINRALARIGESVPARLAAFRLDGDGTTLDFRLPEPVQRVLAVERNGSLTPPISFQAAIGTSGLRSLLIPDLLTAVGFAFRPPYHLRIEPALSSGSTLDAWCFAGPGKLLATAYTTGTASVTNGSATVTGSGTTFAATHAGHSIKIGGEVYIVDSVASATSLTLTELYRGATATGLSYSIGGDVAADDAWIHAIVYSACEHLFRWAEQPRADEYAALARLERRKLRARMDRVSGASRG